MIAPQPKPISAKAAEQFYGISSSHSEMPNGEYRFRLNSKGDGTAYIRTVASNEGGWQNAHFHTHVFETYIVQKGWVGYAELVENTVRISIFQAGSLFTTRAGVIHNVYMPAKAVIHTVKHGESAGEDRFESEETRRFTQDTKRLTEQDIFDRSQTPPTIEKSGLERPATPPPMNTAIDENYRHFDTLIWQTSAWSSGLFTLALAGVTQIDKLGPTLSATGFNNNQLLAALSAMFGGFILVISHALYRFRWHQRAGRGRAGLAVWRSPQFGLQNMVNVQAMVLLGIALLCLGLPKALVAGLLFVPFLTMLGYQESMIEEQSEKSGLTKVPS